MPSPKEGHQPIILPNLDKNYMKMKKIGLRGTHLKFYCLDPPLFTFPPPPPSREKSWDV